MKSKVEICIIDENENPHYADISSIYTDEYNENNKVIIINWLHYYSMTEMEEIKIWII